MRQRVELVWFPSGWAPTTVSVHTSIRAAERAGRSLAKRQTGAGSVFIRTWYGPDAGERTLYRLTKEVK